MKNKKDSETSQLQTATIAKTSKKYVGPFVKKGHVFGGKTYNPETMTDEEIEFFQQLVPESKEWWITSTGLPENTENEGSENLTYDT